MNGDRRQSGNLDQMIWSVNEIVSEISRLVELTPGDIIFTGTPSGVGRVEDSDTIHAAIDKLGSFEVTVADINGYAAKAAAQESRNQS